MEELFTSARLEASVYRKARDFPKPLGDEERKKKKKHKTAITFMTKIQTEHYVMQRIQEHTYAPESHGEQSVQKDGRKK